MKCPKTVDIETIIAEDKLREIKREVVGLILKFQNDIADNSDCETVFWSKVFIQELQPLNDMINNMK